MMSNWPDTPAASTVAQATLSRLKASVAIARGLAGTGRIIDLTGLEAATGLLCAQVLDLSPDQSSAIRPELIELDGSIRELIHLIRGAPN